jgi:hypothetical protein
VLGGFAGRREDVKTAITRVSEAHVGTLLVGEKLGAKTAMHLDTRARDRLGPTPKPSRLPVFPCPFSRCRVATKEGLGDWSDVVSPLVRWRSGHAEAPGKMRAASFLRGERPGENEHPEKRSLLGTREQQHPEKRSLLGMREPRHPERRSLLGMGEPRHPEKRSLLGMGEPRHPERRSLLGTREPRHPEKRSLLGMGEQRHPKKRSLLGMEERRQRMPIFLGAIGGSAARLRRTWQWLGGRG